MWKDKCYEESKGLSVKDYLNKIHKNAMENSKRQKENYLEYAINIYRIIMVIMEKGGRTVLSATSKMNNDE